MKKARLLLAIVLLIMLSACSTVENVSQSDTNNQTSLYYGSYKIWDTDFVKQVFLSDYDNFSEDELDLENSLIGRDSVRIDDEQLGNGIYNLYRYKDGRMLFCDAGTIAYNRDTNDMRCYMNISKFDIYPTIEPVKELYPRREIDGISSDEALKITSDIVEQLEIPCIGEPQIYTCTGTAYDDEGNDLVPPKDAYYILYHSNINNTDLPYEFTYFSSVGWEGNYGYAEFIVSADGIESADIQYIFDYQENDICSIIPHEEAVKILQNTVGRAAETGKTEYSSGVFTYIADGNSNTGESTLYPVWLFIKTTETEVTSGDGAVQPRKFFERIFVDARNGIVLN